MITIHTFVYNQNTPEINIQILPWKCILWNYSMVFKLIESKYPNWIVYFKRLILNKSRENFLKYILMYEFGGIFINIELLKSLNLIDMMEIEQQINSNNSMIFWQNNHNKSDLVLKIFGVNKYIVNGDIFIIKNNFNSFIGYLLEQISPSHIPTNEYTNTKYLGDIFLSIMLENFYSLNLDASLEKKNFFGFNYGSIESKYNLVNPKQNKYEKSIYYIELVEYFPFNLEYKLRVYQDIPELTEPELKINSYLWMVKIRNFFENFIIVLTSQYIGWIGIFSIVLIVCMGVIIDYIINDYIVSLLDVRVPKAIVDSQTLFNVHKYKFLSKLKTNWKIIRDEAVNVMNYAPKLDISRTSEDWYDAITYIKSIKDKYGWIRSWTSKQKPDNLINDKNNYDNKNKTNNPNKSGNYDWLNYGLMYFGEDFSSNTKSCPRTYELLNEIKSHINICGFSWMAGGCVIPPHKDITGIESGSLAMHLGLDIPKPENSCRLVIKNSSSQYTYVNEENGRMFIFDATNEHYAYNLSNHDRLILYIDFKIL